MHVCCRSTDLMRKYERTHMIVVTHGPLSPFCGFQHCYFFGTDNWKMKTINLMKIWKEKQNKKYHKNIDCVCYHINHNKLFITMCTFHFFQRDLISRVNKHTYSYKYISLSGNKGLQVQVVI